MRFARNKPGIGLIASIRLDGGCVSNYSEFMDSSLISINPEIRFGKPCITGTRITVGDILEALASGDRITEIVKSFPELTEEEVRAAIAFAAARENNSKILIST